MLSITRMFFLTTAALIDTHAIAVVAVSVSREIIAGRSARFVRAVVVRIAPVLVVVAAERKTRVGHIVPPNIYLRATRR